MIGRARLRVDIGKDGTLDRSTVFADQRTDLADNVFFTNLPKLWRLLVGVNYFCASTTIRTVQRHAS